MQNGVSSYDVTATAYGRLAQESYYALDGPGQSSGNLTVNGNLTVDGTAVISGLFSADGNAAVGGDLGVIGDLDIGGDFTIANTGSFTLSCPATINGDVDMSGNTLTANVLNATSGEVTGSFGVTQLTAEYFNVNKPNGLSVIVAGPGAPVPLGTAGSYEVCYFDLSPQFQPGSGFLLQAFLYTENGDDANDYQIAMGFRCGTTAVPDAGNQGQVGGTRLVQQAIQKAGGPLVTMGATLAMTYIIDKVTMDTSNRVGVMVYGHAPNTALQNWSVTATLVPTL